MSHPHGNDLLRNILLDAWRFCNLLPRKFGGKTIMHTCYRFFVRKELALLIGCLGCLWFVSSCAAQEIEGIGESGAAVFSNATYLEVSTPFTDRVQSNLYGFYLGNVEASIALVEVPVKVQKYITITPGYLWIGVPARGLSLVQGVPASSSYRENQVRLSASFTAPVHRFIVSDRNMYADRYTPRGQVNRYRNRLYVAHPISLANYKVNVFAYDEMFHDFGPGKWLRRNWVAAGVDLPVNRHVTLEPLYLHHQDSLLRSVNFLALGVVVRTGRLF